MSARGPLRHLAGELGDLDRRGLLRRPGDALVAGPGDIVLCSNDYLAYGRAPGSIGPGAPLGAGASRLVCGEHEAHRVAERALAEWVGAEDVLLFSSGYAANVGTIAALAGPDDCIVSDALNHASIVDGCRLSRARIAVVPHLDVGAVERALEGAASARRRWVVTESYFSMDGDSPDLPALRTVCDRWDAALVVDEAHAIGVLGPRGAGRCAEQGIMPDVLIGTLGKALGLQGAFVAGPAVLRTWLWNRARSFVFSTGMSPALASAAAERVARCQADEATRASLRAATERLRSALARVGVEAGGSGPIVPVIVGEPAAAWRAARRLRELGVFVQAIRPPTVPVGTSRLRVTAHAGLSADDLARCESAFRALIDEGLLARAPRRAH